MNDFVVDLISDLSGVVATAFAAFWGAKIAVDSLLEKDCDDCECCCDDCECGCNCRCKQDNKEE